MIRYPKDKGRKKEKKRGGGRMTFSTNRAKVPADYV